MKTVNSAALAVLGALLFAGFAHAQPAANASVTAQFSGEVVTAVDGDDTCVFIGPFRKLAGLPPADLITIQCYNVGHTATFSASITVKQLGSGQSSSFSSNGHVIAWTITRASQSEFDWDISVDGLDHVGVF